MGVTGCTHSRRRHSRHRSPHQSRHRRLPSAFAASQKRAWLYRRWSANGTETAVMSAVVEEGCSAHQTGTQTWKAHLLSGGLFPRACVTGCTHPCRRIGGDGDGEDVLSEWHLRDERNDSFAPSFREGR